MSFEVVSKSEDDVLQANIVQNAPEYSGMISLENNPSEGVNAAVAYLAELQSGDSRRAVRSRLNVFARWMGFPDASVCPWERLRYIHVVGFVHELSDKRGLAASSVNVYLSALKGVAETAWRLRQIDLETRSEIRAVKQLRVHREPAGRALTYSESARLMEAVKPSASRGETKDESKGERQTAAGGDASAKVKEERCRAKPDALVIRDLRDQAILALLLGCGLRRAEVTTLDLEQLDMGQGTLRVIGKGNKERLAFLTAEIRERLHDWLAVRGPDPGWLFGRIRKGGALVLDSPLDPASIGRIVDHARQLAGIDAITTHDLRRTFATRLLSKNVDIVAVKNLMGHASVTTTAKYDRRSEEALQRAAMQAEL